MTHDRADAQERFDVDIMRRNQIENMLIGLSLSAWIVHATIIVIIDGDVKNRELGST